MMGNAEWIALAGIVLSTGIASLSYLRGGEKIRQDTNAKITGVELAFERKLSQQEVGLRAQINDLGFYVRDNYVNNEVFSKMIEMAAASNENQFRALSESLLRLMDKIDIIQAEMARLRPPSGP